MSKKTCARRFVRGDDQYRAWSFFEINEEDGGDNDEIGNIVCDEDMILSWDVNEGNPARTIPLETIQGT